MVSCSNYPQGLGGGGGGALRLGVMTSWTGWQNNPEMWHPSHLGVSTYLSNLGTRVTWGGGGEGREGGHVQKFPVL